MNMKVSVSTWSFTNYNFDSAEKIIDVAANNGISALDITFDDYEKYFRWTKASDAEIERHFSCLKKYADGKGVQLFQTHAPFAPFPHFLSENFFNTTVKALLATKAAGAKYCVFHSLVFPLYGKKDLWEEELNFNIKYLARLEPYLSEYGIVLCLENLYDWDKGEIRKIFVSEISGLNEYLSRFDENHFGACLDTGHLNMFGGKPAEAVRLLGNRLKVLHLHDNDGIKDQHLIPYMGNTDWTGFSAALEDVGYSGTLNLEIKPFFYTKITESFWKYVRDLTLKTGL